MHNHLLFCERCQSTQSVFSAIHTFLTDEELRLCREHLEILDEQIRNSSPFGRSRSGERYRKARDWRTVVLADYPGFSGDMAKYCSAEQRGQPGFHPWMNLRKGDGNPKAAAFVQGLSQDLFDTALMAFEIQDQGLRICPGVMSGSGPFLIPSCGDIREVKGLLQPVVTWDTSSWRNWIDDEQFLSGRRSNSTAADLLEMAADAALFRSHGLKPPTPALPRIEPPQDAEHMARHAVGPETFDRLCRAAQHKLVDAESRLQKMDSLDWASVVSCYTTALEAQIEASIYGPVRASRKQGSGSHVSTPGQPLPLPQSDWPFNSDKVTLGSLRYVLRQGAPRFESKVKELGIDVKSLLTAIEDVLAHRNSVSHGGQYSLNDARRIISGWLSINRPDNPNIFQRILPGTPAGTR